MFKDIKGYEGKYQINEYGVVKSKSRQKGAVFLQRKNFETRYSCRL